MLDRLQKGRRSSDSSKKVGLQCHDPLNTHCGLKTISLLPICQLVRVKAATTCIVSHLLHCIAYIPRTHLFTELSEIFEIARHKQGKVKGAGSTSSSVRSGQNPHRSRSGATWPLVAMHSYLFVSGDLAYIHEASHCLARVCNNLPCHD